MQGDIEELSFLSCSFAYMKPVLWAWFMQKWYDCEPVVARKWCKQYMAVCGHHFSEEVWSHIDIPAGTPNTNNSIEATNLVMKNECTHWQRNSVNDFLRSICVWTRAIQGSLSRV